MNSSQINDQIPPKLNQNTIDILRYKIEALQEIIKFQDGDLSNLRSSFGSTHTVEDLINR